MLLVVGLRTVGPLGYPQLHQAHFCPEAIIQLKIRCFNWLDCRDWKNGNNLKKIYLTKNLNFLFVL